VNRLKKISEFLALRRNTSLLLVAFVLAGGRSTSGLAHSGPRR
jgi:hypothetical protein